MCKSFTPAHSFVANLNDVLRPLQTVGSYSSISQKCLRSLNETAAHQQANSAIVLTGTFLKYILGSRYCGKNVRPTGVEKEVCERLRRFRFRQAVIHRPAEVSRQLRDLA